MWFVIGSAIASVVVYSMTFGDLVSKVTDRAKEIEARGGFDECLRRANEEKGKGRRREPVYSEEGVLI